VKEGGAGMGMGAIVTRNYAVYRGKEELAVGGTRALPVATFLRRLHARENHQI
jgi:hypothetical protein